MKSFEGMVEAISGAEETDEHNDLFCRFRKKKHREVGIILALAWNLKVLSRLRCMNQLVMEVMPIRVN